MTVQYFRLLLVGSLVVAVLSGGIDLVFPALVPEAFHQVQQAHDSSLSTMHTYSLAALGIVFLVLLVASYYGLYMFRPWAPRIALASTAVALVVSFGAGTYAQSGLAIAASYLASYLWGAVLVFALFHPFSSQFQRRDG